MCMVVGPVVARNGGFMFDSWTEEAGISHSFCYGRVEDAHYARKFEMKCQNKNVDCDTFDQFTSLVAQRR
jgi:hypothetical protein